MSAYQVKEGDGIDPGYRLLRRRQHWQVCYVHPADEVSLRISGRQRTVFQKGIDVHESNHDFDAYDDFFERHGYAPPGDTVWDVEPAMKSEVPGIEIYCSRGFVQHRMYRFFDVEGLDASSFSLADYRAVHQHRMAANARVRRFIERDLLRVHREGHRAYGRFIASAIRDHFGAPEKVFEALVLTKPQMHVFPYNAVNLEEAIDADVRIGIDWVIARQILAYYATRP